MQKNNLMLRNRLPHVNGRGRQDAIALSKAACAVLQTTMFGSCRRCQAISLETVPLRGRRTRMPFSAAPQSRCAFIAIRMLLKLGQGSDKLTQMDLRRKVHAKRMRSWLGPSSCESSAFGSQDSHFRIELED